MASPEALAAAAPYAPHFTRPLEEVAEDLESFCHLFTKWSRTQNLVSRETIENLWTRHVADSLQVLKYLSEADVYLCDLGSGGGFPAIPVAVARKGSPEVICPYRREKVQFSVSPRLKWNQLGGRSQSERGGKTRCSVSGDP